MAEEQTTKTCTVCGIDVTGKPRTKDAQGRYICKDCFDKARATQSALKNPPPPPGAAQSGSASPAIEDNSFLLGMGAKNAIAESGTKPCPECGRALTTDSVVCVGCGYNTATGKRMAVRVLKPEKAEDDGVKGKGRSSGKGTNPHLIGLAVLGLFTAGAVAGMLQPDVATYFALAVRIYMIVIHIWVVVTAWQDETGYGIGCLLCGPFEIYWVLAKSENTLMKWLYMSGLLANIMGIIMSPEMLAAFSEGAASVPPEGE